MRKLTPLSFTFVAGMAVSAFVASATTFDGSSRHRPAARGVSGRISIIAKWTGDEQKSFEAVLGPFKAANPGVSIKYTGAGDNVAQVVSTAVAGGNPPDIATLPQPGLMAQFARRGAAKPIDFAKGVIAANFKPVWLQLGSVNGKLYGLFFKGANKSTVWYNVKSFKNAGVAPPPTFEDLVRRTAKTLRASGTKAYSIGGADGWTLTDLFENIYLRSAGRERYDALSMHSLAWTDPSVKAALRVMALILEDTQNLAGGKTGALQTDFPTSVSNVFRDAPRAAMVIEGDFVPGVVASKDPLKPITGYNVFDFPSVFGSPPAVMGGGDVVVMFKSNPASQALIKYLATAQPATIWAKRGGFSSPNENVEESAYRDPLNRKTSRALACATLFRFDLSDLQPAAFGATAGQGMWKLFQDFLANPTDVNGIAAKLEAGAAKAYKGVYAPSVRFPQSHVPQSHVDDPSCAATATNESELSSAPLQTFPEEPQTASGEDPLDVVPEPKETAPGVPYPPLGKLDWPRAENPLVPNAPVTRAATIRNKKKQRFTVYVSAGRDATARRFIARLAGAVEAFPLKKRIPAAVEAVPFDRLLLAAAVARTGRSEARFATVRERLPARSGRSFRAILVKLHAAPDKVIDTAARKASAALRRKVAAGQLRKQTVDTLDVRKLLRRLIDARGAPFIVSPAVLPRNTADIARWLRADRKNRTAITVRPLSRLPARRNAVWFAFDPVIGPKEVHLYVQDAIESWVQILARKGTETVTFRRSTYPVSRSQKRFATQGYSSWANDKSERDTPIRFLAAVTGNGDYDIKGLGRQPWQERGRR